MNIIKFIEVVNYKVIFLYQGVDSPSMQQGRLRKREMTNPLIACQSEEFIGYEAEHSVVPAGKLLGERDIDVLRLGIALHGHQVGITPIA